MSSIGRPSGGLDTPASTAAIVSASGPPPPSSSITSRSGVPMANSPTPARSVSPVTVQTIVPGESSVPTDRNHSRAVRAGCRGTFARVSTLSTSDTSAVAPRAAARWRRSWSSTMPRRYGGDHPRERRPAVDHLEQRGLLAEEVLARARSTTGPRGRAVQPALRSRRCAAAAAGDLAGERGLDPTTTSSAPHAAAAMHAPSSTRNGLRRSSMRSLNVPGSPSAALTTTGIDAPVERAATVAHLRPVGEPGAAPAAEAGVGDELDDRLGLPVPGRGQAVTTALVLVVRQAGDGLVGRDPGLSGHGSTPLSVLRARRPHRDPIVVRPPDSDTTRPDRSDDSITSQRASRRSRLDLASAGASHQDARTRPRSSATRNGFPARSPARWCWPGRARSGHRLRAPTRTTVPPGSASGGRGRR